MGGFVHDLSILIWLIRKTSMKKKEKEKEKDVD